MEGFDDERRLTRKHTGFITEFIAILVMSRNRNECQRRLDSPFKLFSNSSDGQQFSAASQRCDLTHCVTITSAVMCKAAERRSAKGHSAHVYFAGSCFLWSRTCSTSSQFFSDSFSRQSISTETCFLRGSSEESVKLVFTL